MKQRITKELDKCLNALAPIDPADIRYGIILDNAGKLSDLLADKNSAAGANLIGFTVDTQPEEDEEPIPTVEPIAAPPLVEVPKDEEPEPQPKPEPEPEGEYPFEDMRAVANEARDKYKIKVGPIMRSFLPEDAQARLSAIPKEKRAAFVAALKEAIANAG